MLEAKPLPPFRVRLGDGDETHRIGMPQRLDPIAVHPALPGADQRE
jgi:hypothetical protein